MLRLRSRSVFVPGTYTKHCDNDENSKQAENNGANETGGITCGSQQTSKRRTQQKTCVKESPEYPISLTTPLGRDAIRYQRTSRRHDCRCRNPFGKAQYHEHNGIANKQVS